MNFFKYIKTKGIKQAIGTIYKYKIDIILQKIMKLFLYYKPLENIIIIESHNDFDCNGGAFYEYLISNNYNKKYKIIWLLKNDYIPVLPPNVTCFNLFKPSIRKSYYIARAKLLVADSDITSKIREDQVSIFFDHGAIALKNVTQFYSKLADKVDYILSPSSNYDEVLCKQFCIKCPNEKMLHFGYPSEDIYFHECENEIKKITNIDYKKAILWMPTFRVGKFNGRNDSDINLPFGIPLIQTEDDMKKIQKLLETENVVLIIKIHPLQDPDSYKRLKAIKTKNIIVLDATDMKKFNLDNYRLLKFADAMISDYSSTIYSFLLLNRPAAFVLNDLKEYKLGYIVDNIDDWVYGDRIYSFNDFFDFVHKCVNDIDDHKIEREKLMHWIYEYRDGNACKRIVEFANL